MARYIDVDKLLEELKEEIDFESPMYTEEQLKYFGMGLRCAYRDVVKTPTADVVEVVRCKDCKHFGKDLGYGKHDCKKYEMPYCLENDYCSYGERKE